MSNRILVIKLGALGDFIQATGSFADIRAHGKGAHITLLTTKAMLPLAANAPFFDAISLDERLPFWNIPYILRMRTKLQGFQDVIDLQTNTRSNTYFWLAGRPSWSGIAKGCSHPHANPNRNTMHTLDRLAEQLQMAGIDTTHAPDVRYAAEDSRELLKSMGLKNFVALIPGGSKGRPEKRWPHFAELAKALQNKGYQVALIGGPDEMDLLQNLSTKTGAINLGGRTSINALIDLLPRAKYVIGNDTGPMHLAAASGAKGVVLFGSGSNPDLCAPRAKNIHILHQSTIGAISPIHVLTTLNI
jgi:ADP-heptose:LPS heptosyltransferase